MKYTTALKPFVAVAALFSGSSTNTKASGLSASKQKANHSPVPVSVRAQSLPQLQDPKQQAANTTDTSRLLQEVCTPLSPNPLATIDQEYDSGDGNVQASQAREVLGNRIPSSTTLFNTKTGTLVVGRRVTDAIYRNCDLRNNDLTLTADSILENLDLTSSIFCNSNILISLGAKFEGNLAQQLFNIAENACAGANLQTGAFLHEEVRQDGDDVIPVIKDQRGNDISLLQSYVTFQVTDNNGEPKYLTISLGESCSSQEMSPTASPTPRLTTNDPTLSPSTATPTGAPSSSPSGAPNPAPTSVPTFNPTNRETTLSPSHSPTGTPISLPSGTPTSAPTYVPSVNPTNKVTTLVPSHSPTGAPTFLPSFSPDGSPTVIPSFKPSGEPNFNPSNPPAGVITFSPSGQPSILPSITTSTSPSTPIEDTNAPTQPPKEDKSDGLSPGAIAGIAGGSIVAAAGLGVLICWLHAFLTREPATEGPTAEGVDGADGEDGADGLATPDVEAGAAAAADNAQTAQINRILNELRNASDGVNFQMGPQQERGLRSDLMQGDYIEALAYIEDLILKPRNTPLAVVTVMREIREMQG